MFESLKSWFGYSSPAVETQAQQVARLEAQLDAANVRGWNKALSVEQKLQAAYDAAIKRDDLWTEADFRDADATLLPDHRRYLRAHSRYEAANNPLIDRILKVWVEDVVGETGPWLSIASGSGPVDRALESLWAKWWKRTGQTAKLRTAVRAEAVDGEALAIRRPLLRNVVRAGIAADLVLLECDRLASPNWSNSNRSNYVDGVHLDSWTQLPVAYDILKAHPGTEYADQVTEIYEAVTLAPHDVLHAFRTIRPEQHRGLPRGTAALMLAGMVRKFLNGQVDKAALQAAFAFAIKSMAPPDPQEEQSTDGLWQRVNLPEGRGLGIMFPDGYEPIQFRTDGDSEGIDPFMQTMCVLYAGCYGMPLGRAMGKYGSSNYPAVRGELLPYRRQIVAARGDIWEPLWLEPLYHDFLREARIHSTVQQALAQLSEQERAQLDLQETEWHWGGEDLVVDPSREESAREKKLKLGIRTREQEFSGQDLEATDARASEQLGIVDKSGKPDVLRYRQILCKSLHGVDPGDPGADSETSTGRANDTPGDPVKPMPGEGQKPATVEAALKERWGREYVNWIRANNQACGLPVDTGLELQANCGTGKGGFHYTNTCQRLGHRSSSGLSSRRLNRSLQKALRSAGKDTRAEIVASEEARQSAASLFQVNAEAALKRLATAVGAPDDAIVTATDDHGRLKVRIEHPAFQAHRIVSQQDGQIVILATRIQLTDDARGKGVGMILLQRQIQAAERLGIGQLQAYGTPGAGGTTLARLGFDRTLAALRRESPRAVEMAEKAFPRAKTVLDIVNEPGGDEWWRTYGTELRSATFDLAPGSKSRRAFAARMLDHVWLQSLLGNQVSSSLRPRGRAKTSGWAKKSEYGTGEDEGAVELQANCGTGKGGFQAGNSCAKGRGTGLVKGAIVAGGGISGVITDRQGSRVTVRRADGQESRHEIGDLADLARNGLLSTVQPASANLTFVERPPLTFTNHPPGRRKGSALTQERVQLTRERMKQHDADLERVRQRVLSIESKADQLTTKMEGLVREGATFLQQRDRSTDARERRSLKQKAARRIAAAEKQRRQIDALRSHERDLAITLIGTTYDSMPFGIKGKSRKADKIKKQETERFYSGLLGKNMAQQHSPETKQVSISVNSYRGRRSFANGATINMSAAADTGVWVHEAGHTLETIPGVRTLANGFLYHRIEKSDPERLSQRYPGYGFRFDEIGHKDDFDKCWGDSHYARYVGKIYSHESTEVMSMGLEMLHNRPLHFAKSDPEFFKFIVGTTSGVLL